MVFGTQYSVIRQVNEIDHCTVAANPIRVPEARLGNRGCEIQICFSEIALVN